MAAMLARLCPRIHAVLSVSLLCGILQSGVVRADISDIKFIKGEISNQIEIRFSSPLQQQRDLPGTSEKQLVLELRSLDEALFESWSSNRIDIDDEVHDLSTVLLEGSNRGGIRLTIIFREGVHYEALPQYSNYHVVLTTSPTATYERMTRAAVADSPGERFAITLESRRKMLPTPKDVPRTLAADHLVYTIPDEKNGQPLQHLRIGFWGSAEEAESVLASLRASYPDARLSQVSEQEAEFATNFALNPQIALRRVDMAQPDFVEPKSVSTRIAAITPSSIDSGDSADTPFEWNQPSPSTPAARGQSSAIPAKKSSPDVTTDKLLSWQSTAQRNLPAAPETMSAAPVNKPSSSSAAPSELDELMDAGDRAMKQKNYPAAISLYTKANSMATEPQAEEALEKLGIARELNGQIAQANKVYEDFLSLYPDSVARSRVEQRLATLRAIDSRAPVALKQASRKDDRDWSNFVGVSQFYRRQMLEINNDHSVPIDALFSDFTIAARKSGNHVDHDAQLSLSHLQDFTGTLGGKDFQISRAYWGSYLTDWSTGLRVGRQTKYDAGVTGRFDGAVLTHDMNSQLEFGLAAGYLVDSSFDMPGTDRPFYGLYGNYTTASGTFGIGPFIVQQKFDGMTDRQAIGLQAQYIGDVTFLRAMVDYDTYHSVLNNVLLVANLGMGKQTSYTLSVEQSRSPYLTTRNALIGQPFEDLGDLEQELVDLSLRDVASDRTSVNRSVQFGVNHKINDSWELSADLIGMDTSSTDSSANVEALDSRQDVSYSGQIRALDLFGVSTYSGFLIRRLDGEDSSTTSFYWNNRLGLGSNFWFYPRVRVDVRSFDAAGQHQTSIIPSMGVDYQFDRRFRFELEVGYEHTTREMIREDIDITGLFIRAGYRALF